MDEINESSIRNTRINLARNAPVALVVGAAGFFGSYLVDELLSKGIQVIGVDDLSFGKRANLSKASEDKNFHLLIEDPDNLKLELEKLDYFFIASEKEVDLKKLIEIFKGSKCRLLFLSSVELYGEEMPSDLAWLKKAESEVAKAAKNDNLNARILRLGPVYGPRMSFSNDDPLTKLIAQELRGELQKEISMDFSSRALFIDDAISLSIKCILAGATAQKIFDGVLPSPIKVSEIKQILLDPVWHESRNFEASELPPWPTPNLDKTIKFLNWHPKSKLVENLRKTISYFKDNEINIPKVESVSEFEKKEAGEWKKEKTTELSGLKGEEVKEAASVKDSGEPGKRSHKSFIRLPKLKFNLSRLYLLLALAFITYALIWPFFELGWGVLTFRFQLLSAVQALEKGEFDQSLSHINQASLGVDQAKSILLSLEPLRNAGVLNQQFEVGDDLSNLATLSVDSAQNTILGINALYQGLKSVTGEKADSPKDSFNLSNTYLSAADEDLSKAYALLNDPNFKNKVPGYLKERVDSLESRLSLYSGLVKKARALSSLLPEVVALDGAKSYLVLLQNNNELRPTGGFIGSFALISFEGGKLKKLDVNDVYAIDGQLNLHVEPPKEIKEDLNQKDYFLRDSNWEPDFPTSARQIEWFYNKETGQRVEGVVALDVSAVEDLLSVLGPLDLPDYSETITADNLFQKAISHAEVSFFPGTQAKKSFLTALSLGVFNKLFFLPNQNWPGIVSSMGRSMEGKHMSVYLDNPKLFSYVVSQNWGSVMPRAADSKGDQLLDFLAPVEANLGANKANYYLDRSVNLETVVGKDGEINHRMRISYTNRSPSDAFPGGKYKNRMRVYLPFGTKLNRALWGETDITKKVTNFVDYGRSGYSFLLELSPKEQKTLVLDYQIPQKLTFVNNQSSYRLDVVKQAGTLKDPFVWKVSYPLNLKLTSGQGQKIGPQEQTIQTDLSKDRSFELTFHKD